VTVTTVSEIAGVTLLRATVEGAAAANEFAVGAPNKIGPGNEHVLALRFDKDHTGDVTVTVEALAGTTRLASGTASGHVDPSGTARLTVTLTRIVADIDMKPGPDLTMVPPDLLPPPDLTPPRDMTVPPDLVPPPDMAMGGQMDGPPPDYAMVAPMDGPPPDIAMAVVCTFDNNFFDDGCVFGM